MASMRACGGKYPEPVYHLTKYGEVWLGHSWGLGLVQSVGRLLPLPGLMKTERHTGTDTSGLGPRVAEVAGDDRYRGVSWVVCVQVCW